MKYQLQWGNTSSIRGKKCFDVRCRIQDHPLIQSFYIKIEEDDALPKLNYLFDIDTISVTGPGNGEKMRANQKTLLSYFAHLKLNMNDWSSFSSLNLIDATKDSTLACTLILFKLVDLSKKDQDEITQFINNGIFTHKQLYAMILELVNQNKLQDAYDKAVLAERQDYKGMMFETATLFLEKGHIQPAYGSFASVPAKDESIVEAQIAAAKLATRDEVHFSSHKERLKAIFTHCQNAGPEGQPYIINYFFIATKLDSTKYKIENVGTDFETLATLVSIIAIQNDELQHLKNENQLLRKQLAEATDTTASTSPFFDKKGDSIKKQVDQIDGPRP